jgi:hypothetical protein
MSTDLEPIDILFIVPDRLVDTYRRATKLVFWSLEVKKTFDVLSADSFVRLYGDMSVEDMDMALKKRCNVFVNSGDISKREWAAFKPVRQRLYDYWKAFEEGKQP